MFCKNCGGEILDNDKFCPYCGTKISAGEVSVGNSEAKTKKKATAKSTTKSATKATTKIAKNDTATTIVADTININSDTKLVAARCTQCGAQVEVDPGQEAAVCKFCKSPFIVSKAINNYILDVKGDFDIAKVDRIDNVTVVNKVSDEKLLKIMAANTSAKKFQKEYTEFEAKLREKLMPKEVKISIFGRTRKGTEQDIDREEYSRKLGKFIKDYNVPRDKESLMEFYTIANEKGSYSYLDATASTLDSIMVPIWREKARKIAQIAQMLYPDNEGIKAMIKDNHGKTFKNLVGKSLKGERVTDGDVMDALGSLFK